MGQSKRTLSAFRTLEEIKKYSSYDEKRLKSREFRHVSSILNKIGFVNSPLTLDTLSKKTKLSKHVLRKHISSLSKAGLLYRIVYSYKSDSYIFITGYKGKDFYSLIESGRIGILSGLDKIFGPERKMKIKDFLSADISSVSFFTGETLNEAEILKILHDVHRVLWTRRGSVFFNRVSEEEINFKGPLENFNKEEENNILALSNSHEREFFNIFPSEDRTNTFLSNFFSFESSGEKIEMIEKEEATMELKDISEEISKKEKERSKETIGYEVFENEEDFDDETFGDREELNYDDNYEEGEGQHTIKYISFRELLGKKEEEPEYIPNNVDENGRVSYISAREMFDFFKKEKEKRKKDIETMERELDEIFGFSDSDVIEEESQTPQKDTLEELQELFKQLIEVSKEKKKYEKELKEKLSKPSYTSEPGEDLERLKNIAKDWKEKTSYIKEEESKLKKRFVFSNELKEKAFEIFERINDLKKLGKIEQAKEEYRKAYEFLKQETGHVFIPREWEFGRHVIDPLDPFERNDFNQHDYYYIEMFKNKLVHNFFGGYRFFQRLALKQLKEAGLLKGGPLDDTEYAAIAKMMGGDDNDENDVF